MRLSLFFHLFNVDNIVCGKKKKKKARQVDGQSSLPTGRRVYPSADDQPRQSYLEVIDSFLDSDMQEIILANMESGGRVL